jgi:hypothetical protein
MKKRLTEKLKENWQQYLIVGVFGIYAITWIWIFGASAKAGCSENDPMVGLTGLCLARRIAGMSCFVAYFAVWTFLGAQVAMAKGRSPVIGLILGFTLQFMGCIIMLIWEPRRDRFGQMIGWDEYKHYTAEQREAIRPVKMPITPEMKRRRKIVIVIAVFVILTFVFQILKNLGKI